MWDEGAETVGNPVSGNRNMKGARPCPHLSTQFPCNELKKLAPSNTETSEIPEAALKVQPGPRPRIMPPDI